MEGESKLQKFISMFKISMRTSKFLIILVSIALIALIVIDIEDKKFNTELVKKNLNICYWSTLPIYMLLIFQHIIRF